MGSVLAHFAATGSRLSWLVISFPVLLAAITAFAAVSADPNGTRVIPSYITIPIVAVLLGLAALAYRATQRLNRIRIVVCERGVVRWRDQQLIDMFRWDEVSQLFRSEVAYRNGAVSVSSVAVRCKDQRTVRFGNTPVDDLLELAEWIERGCYKQLMADVLAKFNSHQPVDFGPLQVCSQGLICGRKSLAWREIGELKRFGLLFNGAGRTVLQIYAMGHRSPWAEFPLGQIPNLLVFAEMVNRMRTRQPALGVGLNQVRGNSPRP